MDHHLANLRNAGARVRVHIEFPAQFAEELLALGPASTWPGVPPPASSGGRWAEVPAPNLNPAMTGRPAGNAGTLLGSATRPWGSRPPCAPRLRPPGAPALTLSWTVDMAATPDHGVTRPRTARCACRRRDRPHQRRPNRSAGSAAELAAAAAHQQSQPPVGVRWPAAVRAAARSCWPSAWPGQPTGWRAVGRRIGSLSCPARVPLPAPKQASAWRTDIGVDHLARRREHPPLSFIRRVAGLVRSR
jgi:hypothetical protein